MTIWETGLAEPLFKFMRNPTDLNAIEKMYRCYSLHEPTRNAVAAKLLSDDRFRRLYEQWYEPKPYSLAELSALPSDTFGYQYAAFMTANGLQPDFIHELGGRDVFSYVWCRARHVHDITHLLIARDTSFVGELAVKGFEIAQNGSPATAAILGAGLLSASSLEPKSVEPLLDAVLDGYRLGKRYPLLMGITWDHEWETPLADLRRKYGLLDC